MKHEDIFVMYMTACLGWRYHPGNANKTTDEDDLANYTAEMAAYCAAATRATVKFLERKQEEQWQASPRQQ